MDKLNVKIQYIFDQIEDKVTKEMGPMARFVVNKALTDMGKKKDELTIDDLPMLNKKITETAIPDISRRQKIQESIDIIVKQTRKSL